LYKYLDQSPNFQPYNIFMMVYVISALGEAPFSARDLVPLTVPAQVY